MNNTINLNIQPKASIYALFTRLSYVEWYALAEFVDNSTASYYLHKEELENSNFDKLKITINYDATTDTIIIEDNAFGMELDDFKKAILLESKPTVTGRNEFGYGLKTAATWFGKRWSVESTQLDSTNKYYACIDIDDLVSNKKNETDIIVSSANYDDHGTKITITNLNRRLNTNKIKKNIVSVLNSMYRRDLKAGKIEIIYNGTTLTFSDYPILQFRKQSWKKDITIDFDFDGKHYSASGFVGIMEPGGYEKTGFALFRNDRAIICNYKPQEIFGSQAQTQISLKLFGEIDMNSFEVNQAKDGFSWNSELEEKFISELKNRIIDYIEVAKLSKKEREQEESEENESENQEVPPVNEENNNNNGNNNNNTKNESEENSLNINDETTSNNNQEVNINFLSKKEYVLKYLDENYRVLWTDELQGKFLYDYNQNGKTLYLNLKHQYLKNINEEKIRYEVSKIILSYVLSENHASNATFSNGLVQVSVIHNQLDKILASLK